MTKVPKETSLSAFNKNSLKNTTDVGIGCSTTRSHNLVYKFYSLGKSKGIKNTFFILKLQLIFFNLKAKVPLSKKLCERNISWYKTCFSSCTASEQNNVISSVVSTSVGCLSWWLQPRLVFSCFSWYLEWYLTEYSALLPDPAKLQDFTLLNDVHALLHNCYTVCHVNTLGVLISDLVLACQTLGTSMICKLIIYR